MMNLLPLSQTARDALSAFSNDPVNYLQKAVCQLISPKNHLPKITAIFSLIVLAAAVYYRDYLFGQPLQEKNEPPPPATGPIFLSSSPPRRLTRSNSCPNLIRASSILAQPDVQAEPTAAQRVVEAAASGMERLLEEIRKNPNLIKEDPGKTFLAIYEEFANEGGKYFPSKDELVPSWKRAYKSREQFVILESVYDIYMKSLEVAAAQEKIEENGIIEQLGDGNCWLYSVIEGLKRLGISQIPDHETLRERVVDWMRNNLEDPVLHGYLYDQILNGDELPGAITFHKEQKDRLLREELDSERTNAEIYREEGREDALKETQKKISELEKQQSRLATFGIEEYLQDMAENGCHGSGAELYAISQFLRVDITIYRHFGGKNFSPNCDRPIRCEGAIDEILVTLNYQGDHFDAYIRQEVTSSGLLAVCAAQEGSSPSSSSSSSSSSGSFPPK